ncbi:hypothetical protein B0H16DRAFT_952881 [Mycena metata]|uniref:Uncharacterized protein n=1 Tax=Mycena metata TaxID=1033252 RepID=A0AAD7K5T2_9AGAR|nr:hypothetical protein B0H16DRAFT_952881 [Mycena metata]
MKDTPFIAVVTFIRIAHPPGGPTTGTESEAGVVLKAEETMVEFAPGYTETPCNMMFPASAFPPDSFDHVVGQAFMADPNRHIGLIRGNLRTDYLISYWKKTQVDAGFLCIILASADTLSDQNQTRTVFCDLPTNYHYFGNDSLSLCTLTNWFPWGPATAADDRTWCTIPRTQLTVRLAAKLSSFARRNSPNSTPSAPGLREI